MFKHCPHVGLLVIIFISFTSGDLDCIYNEKDPDKTCSPCDRLSTWLSMANPPGGREILMDPRKKCFNPDPLQLSAEDPNNPPTPPNLISAGAYRYSEGQSPVGFILRKPAFFRYAYDIKQPVPPPTPTASTAEYLDLGLVRKYYDRRDSEKSDAHNTDIQLLEWPGRTSPEFLKYLEDRRNRQIPKSCANQKYPGEECTRYKYWMLRYKGNTGKVIHYPCNRVEGLKLRGLAVMERMTVTERAKIDIYTESEQKLYVTRGFEVLHRNYIQPLYIPERVLEKMAKPADSKKSQYFCQRLEPDCESLDLATHPFCIDRCKALEKLYPKQFEYNRTFVEKNATTGADMKVTKFGCHLSLVDRRATSIRQTYGDLRTVLDFTFTSHHRVVLGMQCGIVVVDGLLSNDITFRVSELNAPRGTGLNKFPTGINKIDSSICCPTTTNCKDSDTVIVAYSFRSPYLNDEDNRFLYVSNDLGKSFDMKIVGGTYTPITLIKGLFQLYSKWHHYFEILNNPDEVDLQEDDDTLRKLRTKQTWATSTNEEKEQFFGLGVPKSEKAEQIFKTVRNLYHSRVPRREERLGKVYDFTPEWANQIFNARRRLHGWQDGWTDENCNNNSICNSTFETDQATEWLLSESHIVLKTPIRNINEPFCKEIISILYIKEESSILALCQVGHEKPGYPTPPLFPGCDPDKEYCSGTFALFSLEIKKNNPVVFAKRVSKRIFSCIYLKDDMNRDLPFEQIVMPALYRHSSSPTIFVINCEGVLYLSPNNGVSLYSAAFYYERQLIQGYCKQRKNPRFIEPSTPLDKECPRSYPDPDPNATLTQYDRSLHLCALNSPPLLSVNGAGNMLLLAFGKFFAVGLIAYNKESRFVVGKSVDELETRRRFENIVIPDRHPYGDLMLTVRLKNAYANDDNIFHTLYDGKNAIRLVEIPIQLNSYARQFFDENLNVCDYALEQKLTFPTCDTNSFFVSTNKVKLDIHDSAWVKVRVKDHDPHLPLWIFATNEATVHFNMQYDNSLIEKHVHNWQVEISAIPYPKPDEESLVDSFYGSDYIKLNTYSSKVLLMNSPTLRCHVQPSTAINVDIGCKRKRMIAFEDIHRPQCKNFRRNFRYTLTNNTFDPDLAGYWITFDKERARFFKKTHKGDLDVIYDYFSWGCPIEPFRSDMFLPDLRIVEEDEHGHVVSMKRFEGKFILIEIFGVKGYSFSRTVEEHGKCLRPPQRLNDMVQEWKFRQRVFQLASKRQELPDGNDTLQESTTREFGGNLIFNSEEIRRHINIWNRANYLSCELPPEGLLPEQTPPPLDNEVLKQQYEIMETSKVTFMETEEEDDDALHYKDEFEEDVDGDAHKENDELNRILWNQKEHQRVYLFLAVAVDEVDSLCNFQTIFGVSLLVEPDMDDLTSFSIFVLFVLFWVFLLVGGYTVRKRWLRMTFVSQARHNKLEQAAWTIVYRYEKLIHGRAMHALLTKGAMEDEQSTSKVHIAAQNVNDQRKAELKVKKTHIVAQSAVKTERLQKLFQNSKF